MLSAPIATSYIFQGAVDLGAGHMEIRMDPYGVRNGSVLKKFDDEREIESTFGRWFTEGYSVPVAPPDEAADAEE